MKKSTIPRVLVTTPGPALAYAGWATAITLDGIQCIVVTQAKSDVQPLMNAMGFAPEIDMAAVKPVAILPKDAVDVQ